MSRLSARRQLIAALSEDSFGGIATLSDVDRAEQLVDAYRAEILAEQRTVCGICGEPVVRFACEQTGGGWMHQDAGDDPAAGADHAAVPVTAPEKASATAPTATPFFQPQHTYAHGGYRFRCEYLVTHPTSGRTFAWGWFGKQGAGWRHASFSDRQYAARTWTDVTTTLGDST